ncbi:MAG: amino acid ABC transporter permease [Prochloraceae cyanobacterium]|nr:amino acid ABC transporter permease [Prochloraceae cyanobacterium]
MFDSLKAIVDAFPSLLLGTSVTLQLTAFSVSIGTILGTLLALARLSRYQFLRCSARFYVDFFRGTPLLVQIFTIYFGLPALFQNLSLEFQLARFSAAIIALSLNSSAYLSEIIRGGIQSIEIGQWEASFSLGMGKLQTLRHIIFPQAIRRMLPPLGNEFIIILKDTSLVAAIGFEELFRRGQLIVANNYRAFEIYITVALIYFGLTLLSSRIFTWLEELMNPVKSNKNK